MNKFHNCPSHPNICSLTLLKHSNMVTEKGNNTCSQICFHLLVPIPCPLTPLGDVLLTSEMAGSRPTFPAIFPAHWEPEPTNTYSIYFYIHLLSFVPLALVISYMYKPTYAGYGPKTLSSTATVTKELKD